MLYAKDTVVFMPARSGSKRIPNKNILKIAGKEMILWPLIELLKIFPKENIIVSTDSKFIKNKLKKFNLSNNYIRPKKLADDYTSTIEVIDHVLKWYETNYSKKKYLLIVYPTAVLLDKKYIIEAFKIMHTSKSLNCVFTAVKYDHPIQRSFSLDKNHKPNLNNKKFISYRTQDLTKNYHDAGQFYLCKSNDLKKNFSIFSNSSRAIVLPKNKAIDIDEMEDILLADSLLKNNFASRKK